MVLFREMGSFHLKQRRAHCGKKKSGKRLSSSLGCASRGTGEPGCESGCRLGAAETTEVGDKMESSQLKQRIHLRKKKAKKLVGIILRVENKMKTGISWSDSCALISTRITSTLFALVVWTS